MQHNHDHTPLTRTHATKQVIAQSAPAPTTNPVTELPLPHRLAWSLADSLKESLPAEARNVVYTQLGCRHYRRAIVHALQSAVREHIALPSNLTGDLDEWLKSYDGHEDRSHITRLLAAAGFSAGPVPGR